MTSSANEKWSIFRYFGIFTPISHYLWLLKFQNLYHVTTVTTVNEVIEVIDDVLQTIIEQLLKKIDDFETKCSDWLLHELSCLDPHTYLYDPLRASTSIPLPDDLKAKHAVVNIQNQV